jgi:guanylate kinase
MTQNDSRRILIISGPSGVGKSTLIQRLLDEFPDLRFSVSHTTRPRRPDEKEGRDYYFISPDEFQRLQQEGAFAEWATVYGSAYGTSWQEIRAKAEQGQMVVLDIDSQGVRYVKEKFPEAVAVLIAPPSLSDLRSRLQKRENKINTQLEQRLQAAIGELRQYELYDYLVVNNDLEEAYQALRSITIAYRHAMSTSLGKIGQLLEEIP